MKNSFQKINSTLDIIMNKHNLTHVYSLDVMKKNWTVMDKTIAAHSVPIKFNPKNKRLTVKIESDLWKHEFFLNRISLLNTIKKYFHNIDIRSIEIT